MGKNKNPQLYNPASHWRCEESGSHSVKYATGHDSMGDQVLHAAKATGRKQNKTFFTTLTKCCRNFFNRLFRKCSCLNKRSVKIISNCRKNITNQTQESTASRDSKMGIKQIPTTECEYVSLSDTTMDHIQDHAGENDNATSSGKDKVMDETIQVAFVETDCDDSSCSDTALDETVKVHAGKTDCDDFSCSATHLDEAVNVPTGETDSDDSSCSDTPLDETVKVPASETDSDDPSCSDTALDETVKVPAIETNSDDSSCSDITPLDEAIKVHTGETNSDDSSSSDTAWDEAIKVPAEETNSDDSSSSDTALDETVKVSAGETNSDDSSCSDTPLDEAIKVHTGETNSDDSSCSDTPLNEALKVPAGETGCVDSSCTDTALAIENDCVASPTCDTSLAEQTEMLEERTDKVSHSPLIVPKHRLRFFRKPVELHHASQPWKPRNDYSTNDLTRKAKSILNKISPENFEKLTIQLKFLNVEDEKDASNLSKILFQKAVEDPTYAYLYAKVCKELMNSFFVILEASNSDEFDWIVNFRFIVAMTAKEEFGKVLQQISEEPNNSQRRHIRGIMNFLAELVNQNVLTCRVAITEILSALKDNWLKSERDHFALECMCTFLSVAGRTIDYANKHPDAESIRKINMYYEFLQVLVEPKGLNTRLRFMIIDLLQLRRNAWFKAKKS